MGGYSCPDCLNPYGQSVGIPCKICGTIVCNECGKAYKGKAPNCKRCTKKLVKSKDLLYKKPKEWQKCYKCKSEWDIIVMFKLNGNYVCPECSKERYLY